MLDSFSSIAVPRWYFFYEVVLPHSQQRQSGFPVPLSKGSFIAERSEYGCVFYFNKEMTLLPKRNARQVSSDSITCLPAKGVKRVLASSLPVWSAHSSLFTLLLCWLFLFHPSTQLLSHPLFWAITSPPVDELVNCRLHDVMKRFYCWVYSDIKAHCKVEVNVDTQTSVACVWIIRIWKQSQFPLLSCYCSSRKALLIIATKR